MRNYTREVVIRVCGYPSPAIRIFWKHYWPWVVNVLCGLGPLLTMCICCAIIMTKVRRAGIERKKMSTAGQQRYEIQRRSSCNVAPAARQRIRSSDNMRTLTALFFAVFVVYLFLVCPSYLLDIVRPLVEKHLKSAYGGVSRKTERILNLVHGIVRLLDEVT